MNKVCRMFPFITKTWNPLGGECKHHCRFCWARKYAHRLKMEKYRGEPRLFREELKKVFAKEDFVFVCDMLDLFGDWVPSDMVQRILDRISLSQATFLLLTKNPKRYLEFDIPANCVCGATIESDYDMDIADAPSRIMRIKAMFDLKLPRKMVSVEPVIYFSPEFARILLMTNPEFVAVGYDNYYNHLEEPTLENTQLLIQTLEDFGVKVYRKTLRGSVQFATSGKEKKKE